ncbi:hypothetical protein FOXYSP1_20236 [Fusarium oxysporum f. sp. phaseoli]
MSGTDYRSKWDLPRLPKQPMRLLIRHPTTTIIETHIFGRS